MIEESCKFFDGISSAYVTSATSLVTIEIGCERFWFVIWPHITLFLKNYLSLKVEATHGKSPPFHICPLV